MILAFSLITAAVLVKLVWLLAEESPSLRRYALATCGAAQIALGVLTASYFAWSSPVFAEDATVLAAEAETPALAEAEGKPVVEVGKTVIIPPGRPEWVSADNAFNREPGAEWVAVVAGPCKTRTECEQELSQAVKKAADEFVNFRFSSPLAGQLLNYDGDTLRRRLVARNEIYSETIQVSFGPMEQLHAHLHFDQSFLDEIDARWKDLKAKWRLAQVGLVVTVLLSLLGTASGFFKVNTATRGQRGSTLQFAAAATILAIVVGGVTAAKYLYWF